MNDESNLGLYSELLLFKSDSTRPELLWNDPQYRLRSTLSSLAHKLDLEYEYSLNSRVARISRPILSNAQSPETCTLDYWNLEHQDNGSLPSGGISGLDSHLSSFDARLPSSSFQADDQFNTQAPSAEALSMSFILSSPNLSGFAGPNVSSLDHDYFSFGGTSPPANTDYQPHPTDNLTTTLDDLAQRNPINQFQSSLSPSVASTDVDHQKAARLDYSARFSSNRSDSFSGSLALYGQKLPQPGLSSSSNIGTPQIPQLNPSSSAAPPLDSSDPSATEDSETNERDTKRQKFYCTDYPPCKLSFTRSEHLARHIRKHISERPFVCKCGRRFRNLWNLQQHAQVKEHACEENLLDSSDTRSVFQRQDGINRLSLSSPVVLPLLSLKADGIQKKNRKHGTSSVVAKKAERRGWYQGPHGPLPLTENTDPEFTPQESTNRSGSVSSFQSEQGQSRIKHLFSRRSSIHSNGASSGYQEIVFDSRSAYSGSQASIVSGASAASGRRGPLDSFAKAAMNAVKRVGACWRCKFLRKSVC